jgi:hypothetical protein
MQQVCLSSQLLPLKSPTWKRGGGCSSLPQCPFGQGVSGHHALLRARSKRETQACPASKASRREGIYQGMSQIFDRDVVYFTESHIIHALQKHCSCSVMASTRNPVDHLRDSICLVEGKRPMGGHCLHARLGEKKGKRQNLHNPHVMQHKARTLTTKN